MNAIEQQYLGQQHQPETVSTASVQSFEDLEGGLSLDLPWWKHANSTAAVGPVSSQPPQTGP